MIEWVYPITEIYNPAIRVLEVVTSAAELQFGKEFADVSHGCKF